MGFIQCLQAPITISRALYMLCVNLTCGTDPRVSSPPPNPHVCMISLSPSSQYCKPTFTPPTLIPFPETPPPPPPPAALGLAGLQINHMLVCHCTSVPIVSCTADAPFATLYSCTAIKHPYLKVFEANCWPIFCHYLSIILCWWNNSNACMVVHTLETVFWEFSVIWSKWTHSYVGA